LPLAASRAREPRKKSLTLSPVSASFKAEGGEEQVSYFYKYFFARVEMNNLLLCSFKNGKFEGAKEQVSNNPKTSTERNPVFRMPHTFRKLAPLPRKTPQFCIGSLCSRVAFLRPLKTKMPPDMTSDGTL